MKKITIVSLVVVSVFGGLTYYTQPLANEYLDVDLGVGGCVVRLYDNGQDAERFCETHMTETNILMEAAWSE